MQAQLSFTTVSQERINQVAGKAVAEGHTSSCPMDKILTAFKNTRRICIQIAVENEQAFRAAMRTMEPA